MTTDRVSQSVAVKQPIDDVRSESGHFPHRRTLFYARQKKIF
jgi:hypothetical protein